MIDLYTVASANGQKVQVMLEEAELAYTPHVVDLYAGAHRQGDFLKLNPFGRVPAIVDRAADNLAIGETLAILMYLAEKSGRFLPQDTSSRSQVLQWLSAISANFGPLFRGIFMFANMVPGKPEAGVTYFRDEAAKAFEMLDRWLADRLYLVGDAYTIADISAYPMAVTSAKNLSDGLTPYSNIQRWVDRIAARPAVQRGMKLFT